MLKIYGKYPKRSILKLSKQIKQQLVEVSKLMYNKGMVNAQEGNASIIDNGKIYITPSSVCKGFLTEEMIAVTDMDGNVLEGTTKPSSEIKLHISAYGNIQELIVLLSYFINAFQASVPCFPK